MSIELRVEKDALDYELDAIQRRVERAAHGAVRDGVRGLEKNLEALTRANVKGRLWRAWGSHGPGGSKFDTPFSPSGIVFVSGGKRSQGAMKYFTEPGVNRGSYGQFLAIPTDAAGMNTRTRDLTPGEWERRTGRRLRFVYRPRRASLLVLDDAAFARSGPGAVAYTVGRQRKDKLDGVTRAVATIPIFVLIPLQRFANRFSVEPTVARAERDLVADFERRLAWRS